jgi:hypothetical protein
MAFVDPLPTDCDGTHVFVLTHLQVGQVSLDYEDDGRSMSSETRQLVEEEVRKLVQVGTLNLQDYQ